MTDRRTFDLPPSCLARYRRERLLGEGGFGSVWLATQLDLDREVAVKVLNVCSFDDAEQRARFHTEAMITAALEHPHIVRLLDHASDEGRPWIAYEYVRGTSLRQELERGPLPWETAVVVARQVLAALACAHERGVLHRDVKPDNVIGTNGMYKVTDFGIAKWEREGAVRTRTGVILGTPVYVSPEQVRGEPPGPASDLYAWGVMLHELIAGRPPFEATSTVKLLEQHLHAQPPRLRERVPVVPRELEELILAMLGKEPSLRPSAESAARALDELGVATPIEPLVRQPRGAPPPFANSGNQVTARTAVDRSSASAGMRTAVLGAPLARRPRAPVAPGLAIFAAGVLAFALLSSGRTPKPGPAASGSASASSPASARAPAYLETNRIAATRLAEHFHKVERDVQSRWPMMHETVMPHKPGDPEVPSAGEYLEKAQLATEALAKLVPAAVALAPERESAPLAELVLRERIETYRFVSWSESKRLARGAQFGLLDLGTEDGFAVYDSQGIPLLDEALKTGAEVIARAVTEPAGLPLRAVVGDSVMLARCFNPWEPGSHDRADYHRVVRAYARQLERIPGPVGPPLADFLKGFWFLRLPGLKSGVLLRDAALELKKHAPELFTRINLWVNSKVIDPH